MAKIKEVKKADKIYVTHDDILIVNGQEYIMGKIDYGEIGGIKHVNKTFVKKFDREKVNKQVDFIVDKIKGNLVKDELIKELVLKQNFNDIDKIYKILKTGKKKIEKQEGCIGIKIGSGKQKTGGIYFQLID